MNNKRDDEPGEVPTRRRFLQGATLTAGASLLAVGPRRAADAGDARRRVGPMVESSGECACAVEGAVPLRAAAFHQGAYVGLASVPSGPGLFTLNVGESKTVSVGPAIEVDLPKDFLFASLGSAGSWLVIGGGQPFVWESYEVDDEMSDDVRALMEGAIPEGIPTTGRRRIDVMGVQPAVFLVDPPYAQPVALPALPRRVFASAGGVAGTDSGATVVLLEHSAEEPESRYAAAADLLVERNGEWTIRPIGRNLGESGPNFLATDGGELVVGLNTSRGGRVIWPHRTTGALPGLAHDSRILGFVHSADGLATLAAQGRGKAQLWSRRDNALTRRGPVELDGDEIVGAIPVAGTRQSIVLGRHSAVLVDEADVLARVQKEASHVV